MKIKTKERIVVNESVDVDAGCIKLNLTREGDGVIQSYSCRDVSYGVLCGEQSISELTFYSKELGEVSIEFKANTPDQLFNHRNLAKEIFKLFKSGE